MNDNYGRCETCKNYGRTYVCANCIEGAEYVYETPEYSKARGIVRGLQRGVAPVPYDNDYANNEHEHIWLRATSKEEVEAIFTLYQCDKYKADAFNTPEWFCVEEDDQRIDFKEFIPENIKQEVAEENSDIIRITSLSYARQCFEEMYYALNFKEDEE